jgi:hypothetical protein
MQHILKHIPEKSPLRMINRVFVKTPGVVWLFITMLGCGGGDHIARTEVHGRVTLDGKPIPQGKIRFLLTDGPVWIATIQDGYYTTVGTKGVPIGKLQVEIQAFRTPTGFNATPQHPDDEAAAPLEQYLPAKYNLRSELTMIIEPGSHSVEQDFELATR